MLHSIHLCLLTPITTIKVRGGNMPFTHMESWTTPSERGYVGLDIESIMSTVYPFPVPLAKYQWTTWSSAYSLI